MWEDRTQIFECLNASVYLKGTPLSQAPSVFICVQSDQAVSEALPAVSASLPFSLSSLKPLRTGDGLKGWLIHELFKVVESSPMGEEASVGAGWGWGELIAL